MSAEQVSLEAFESAAYSRNHEAAAVELSRLLNMLNANLGTLDGIMTGRFSAALRDDERETYLLTRLTSAISCLFSDPSFFLSDSGYGQFISVQRWLGLLFAASPFKNADHVLRLFNVAGEGSGDMVVDARSLPKICMLFSAESEIPLDLDALWQADRRLTACLAFVLMSPRFLASTAAHRKREVLLSWLPDRLDELEDLDHLPLGILHDVYMHCSYADLPSRHAIKRPINRLIRRKMEQQGLHDLDAGDLARSAATPRPVMLVLVEWFTSNHSMFRTHSRAIEGARRHFQVIGMGSPGSVDDITRRCFDEFVAVDFNAPFCDAARIRDLARERAVSVLYMPSVGMFPVTLFLSNLRIAPLQVAGCGHPATLHAACIDRVVVEEDFVGDPGCFSETLLTLPRDGMPYRPSGAMIELIPVIRDQPAPVRVAVASSTMKLNPRFLEACRTIALNARSPVRFHFLLGIGHGLVLTQARNLIQTYLPQAVVHGQQAYPAYLRSLNQCDLFISPFPFGNTNGIVDAMHLGLAGVCKTGAEVFEHIDEALFTRVSLPSELVAHSVAEYVSAAVKLIDQHEWRNGLRRGLLARNAVELLFRGDDAALGERLLQIVRPGRDPQAA